MKPILKLVFTYPSYQTDNISLRKKEKALSKMIFLFLNINIRPTLCEITPDTLRDIVGTYKSFNQGLHGKPRSPTDEVKELIYVYKFLSHGVCTIPSLPLNLLHSSILLHFSACCSIRGEQDLFFLTTLQFPLFICFIVLVSILIRSGLSLMLQIDLDIY